MAEPGPAAALLVVDMQNGFCHRQGSFAKLGMLTDPTLIVPHINELRTAFRAVKRPIFFVRTGYNADYSDRRRQDLQAEPDELEKLQGLVRGSWDADILDELMPLPHEEVVEKKRRSAFVGTSLEHTLKARGIKHVILTGVGTDVCVESTARTAFDMDFRVTIVSDATWTCTQLDHLAALHALRNFGSIASTAEVIKDASLLN